MSKKLYLVKEGEISLKGGNRSVFEKKLRSNIKDKLKPYSSHVEKQKGRIYVYTEEECPDERIEKALSTSFGVTGFARAYISNKTVEDIKEKARQILRNHPFGDKGSFKVEIRREDKEFEKRSIEMACILAEIVSEFYPDLDVNLTKPDYVLTCEIRHEVYLYTESMTGPRGLPVGTAGRGVLLLSGGIDSPVAAVSMAKRGMKLDCIYFHAYPYTSEMALEKVKKLASLVAPYLQGTHLFVVPFTKGQEHIRDNGFEDEATLMFRAAMMQSAEKLANNDKALAIVTGEALSQVASQTLDAMTFTDSMTSLLVLRPLVGMDKEEIIDKAKTIGTYETSILPYEDCCVVFSPKHPLTKPIKEVVKRHYEELGMEAFIDEAIRNTKVYTFNSNGEEITEQSR